MFTDSARQQKATVSFILPALNERDHIVVAISSIHCYATQLCAYEIIVVDNGSTDGTERLAQEAGANVYCLPGVSVAALRNLGAHQARYEYLVFLDADVALTTEWQHRIRPLLAELDGSACTISGSTCGIGGTPSTLQHCWWGRVRPKRQHKYINSGHMVVRRRDFLELGGFNEALRTGEDSEFCQRVRTVAVRILHDDGLKVVHDGYPATTTQFFRRERWHALGDYSSLRIFLRSKPALASVIQLIVLVASILFSFLSSNLSWLMMYPLTVAPLCLFAAYSRAPRFDTCLLMNTFLYFVYFNARAAALVDVALKRRYSRKR